MSFPKLLNIGSGKNFRPDFLNLDCNTYWEPDIVFDLNDPLPRGDGRKFVTTRFGEIELTKNTFTRIVADDVLEHISNITIAMKSCLDLLEEGGIFEIQVPYDLSYGAWQDPTHIRAFNEKSWLYYTDWFWYLGWPEARFTLVNLNFLLSSYGVALKNKGMKTEDILRLPRAVDTMRVQLKKVRLDERDRIYLDHYRGKPRQENTPYCIWLVSPPGYIHSRAFDEVAIGLRGGFRELGLECSIYISPEKLSGTAIVLGCNLLPNLRLPSLPDNLILFNLEQIQVGSPWLTADYLNLLKKYPVWDYSRKNIEELVSLGITNVKYCGIGYSQDLTKIPDKTKDIDILFYGSINERRTMILDALEKEKLNVVKVFGSYGRERDDLIARAKIVLNIHFYDARVFEIIRITYLLANGIFVISERGNDASLEESFAGALVFSDYDSLVENCLHYIKDDQQRSIIAERGFQLIRKCSQSQNLKKTLSIMN